MDNANVIYHIIKKRRVVVTMFMFAAISVLLRYLARKSRPRLLPPRRYSVHAKERANGEDSQSETLAEAENEDTSYSEEDEAESNHPFANHEDEASTQNSPASNVYSGNQESTSTNGSVGKKRKRRNDDVTEKLVSIMHDLGILLARYMAAPIIITDGDGNGIQEKLYLLDGALRSVDGITDEEIYKAHVMFAKNRDLVLVFFGVEPMRRLDWLRTMLHEMAL